MSRNVNIVYEYADGKIEFDDIAKEITPVNRIANKGTIPFNLNDWQDYPKYKK